MSDLYRWDIFVRIDGGEDVPLLDNVVCSSEDAREYGETGAEALDLPEGDVSAIVCSRKGKA